MTFITEVRGPNWLEGKNLHMACVDGFVFGTRGQVGIMLIRTVYKTLGSWSSDGDEGTMAGFARRVRVCRSYTLVVSYFPTESARGDTGAIDLFSDGTDIIDGLPSDTLGALIIGGYFNSHLSRGMRSNVVQVELMVSPHRLQAKDGN